MEQFNMFSANSLGVSPLLVGVVAIWVLFWKGCSLWIAGKNNQKWWFVALLILNTLGILEIIYIFFVAKKKWSDIKQLFSKTTPPTIN
jgi:hypothetical protein